VLVNIPFFFNPLAKLSSAAFQNDISRIGRFLAGYFKILRGLVFPDVTDEPGVNLCGKSWKAHIDLCGLIIRFFPPNISFLRKLGYVPSPAENRVFLNIKLELFVNSSTVVLA